MEGRKPHLHHMTNGKFEQVSLNESSEQPQKVMRTVKLGNAECLAPSHTAYNF